MEKAEFTATSLNVLRWLEYRSDASDAENEGKKEENKKEEEVKKGIYTLLPLLFIMYNILLISEEEEHKGKKAAPCAKKQASSKGQEASDVPSRRQRGDKADDISGTCFGLTVIINADRY